jgi:hypothetical protein
MKNRAFSCSKIITQKGRIKKATPRAQQVPKNELFQAPEEKATPRAQNTTSNE